MNHYFRSIFFTAFILSSNIFANDIKIVTYAAWNKPDVDLLYVLPKEINSDTKVLFVIHGASRNAEFYLEQWIESSKDKNIILVAPHFIKRNFRSYHTLEMSTSSGVINTDKNTWLTGSIKSFYTYFQSKYNLESDTYLMFGFSGGSQFIHRYLMYGEDQAIERAAIGSAGWYTFVESKPFPWGIKNMPLEPGRLEWLMSREVLLLLGSKDNDPLSKSLNKTKGSMEQGSDRLMRGKNYFNSLINVGNYFQVPFRWKYQLVRGVNHDTKQMLEAAIPFMLFDLDYSD